MSSSSPFEGQLCCAICGDAIPPATSEESTGATKWQTQAVLLSDPAREFEQLEVHYRGGKRRDAPRLDLRTPTEIRKDRARVIEGNRLRIIPSAGDGQATEEGGEDEEEEGVLANVTYGREVDGQYVSTPYYIAAHEACLEVAEDAMRHSPHDIVVRDLRTLWKVLRVRFDVDDSYYMSTVTGAVSRPQRVELPHAYYMPFRAPGAAAQSGTRGQGGAGLERWEAAYPLQVPNLTSAILENLKTLPPAATPHPGAIAFRRRFLALPPELRDHVCSFLAPRSGMPGVCNGLLPQWVWRDVFLDGECLPFLQDLDSSVVEDFCAQWGQERATREPNWELLVRKLSQEAWSVWDAESSTLKVPNGLRNRRRVWKLVEEMYVGDLVPVKRAMRVGSDAVAVPRYWDRRGGLVYPVVRVNAGSKDSKQQSALGAGFR
ncbi:hypothetical protein AAE478_010298 [Parahypoxylon ruwenzoriense]